MKVNIPKPWNWQFTAENIGPWFSGAMLVSGRVPSTIHSSYGKKQQLVPFHWAIFFSVQDACNFLDTLEFLGDLSSDQLTLVVWSRGSRTTQLYIGSSWKTNRRIPEHEPIKISWNAMSGFKVAVCSVGLGCFGKTCPEGFGEEDFPVFLVC